jgi:hypothetical protein
MSLRSGSLEARVLFAKKVNAEVAEEWSQFNEVAYLDAVQRVARDKKRPDLINLDHILYQELSDVVKARHPPHITHSELANMMKWKLARGQMRPLQKLVESNSTSAVIAATTRCLEQLQIISSPSSSVDWEASLSALCALKGVGVATATAVLSVFVPNLCPFMADEVIDAVVVDEKRDYTIKIYRKVQKSLVAKAQELNQFEGKTWTAEQVGKALWTCAKQASSPPIDTVDRNINKTKSKAKNSIDMSPDSPLRVTSRSDVSECQKQKKRRKD